MTSARGSGRVRGNSKSASPPSTASVAAGGRLRQLRAPLLVLALFVLWSVVVWLGIAAGGRQAAWHGHPFGSWPSQFGVAGNDNLDFSLYLSGPPSATPPGSSNIVAGKATIGSKVDSEDSASMTGSRFVTGTVAGTVQSASAFVAGPVDTPPHNQFQIAVYSDTHGAPEMLLAESGAGTLVPDAWNTVPLSASLSPRTAYWIMYNSNGTTPRVNNLAYTPLVANPLDTVIRLPQGGWLQRAAELLVLLGEPAVGIALVLVLAVVLGRRDATAALAMVVAFALGLLLEILLKQTLYHSYQSYPSGHALRTVFLTTALFYLTRNQAARAAALTLLVLVCLSVIYTGGHHAEEVIGGAMVGWALASGALTLSLGRRLPLSGAHRTASAANR